MRVPDEIHAKLDAEWHEAFDALRSAGLEHDADHPIAVRYRAASAAVNHANRSRDFSIAVGRDPDEVHDENAERELEYNEPEEDPDDGYPTAHP